MQLYPSLHWQHPSLYTTATPLPSLATPLSIYNNTPPFTGSNPLYIQQHPSIHWQHPSLFTVQQHTSLHWQRPSQYTTAHLPSLATPLPALATPHSINYTWQHPNLFFTTPLSTIGNTTSQTCQQHIPAVGNTTLLTDQHTSFCPQFQYLATPPQCALTNRCRHPSPYLYIVQSQLPLIFF